MPFLALNGITVPVDLDGGAAEWQDQAEADRGLDGTYLSSVTTSKRKWTIGLRTLPARVSSSWARLVKGYGHRMSFVDLFTSKGLLAVGTGSVTPNGASGKFGGVRVTLTSTSTLSWTFGTDRHHGLVADYTISVWHEDSGPVWNHYLIRAKSGDAVPLKWFLNGVDQGAATLGAGSLAWLAVDLTLGKITFTATGGVSHAWAAMVVHPFAIAQDTGEWVTSFSGATAEHPDLPTLRATGTMIAENGLTSIEVECDPQSVKQKPAGFMNAGVWDPGGKEVDFDLEEL